MLTQEERNDLRKKVLRGEALSLDEARSVIETLRTGQAAAMEGQNKPKRAAGKRAGATDEQLEKDLAALGL